MAVTETLRALGSWGLTFRENMPDDAWKKIDYFGHVVIMPGRRPGPLDDSLLRAARYVGPVTSISDSSEAQRAIGGAGMALWLGDAEGKGDIFTDPITVSGNYSDVIRALLPASGAVTEGTFFTIPGTWGSSTFQFQTSRDVIDYVAQTIGAAWRVNGDGTLDFGLESDLFVVNPKCVVARRGMDDMFLRGLYGRAETARDVDDYTTKVVLLAQGINGQFVSAEEELTPGEIPFVDIHGNKVMRARIIQESETDSTNAPARAQLQLNRFKSTRDALTLSTSDYDVKGKAQVGDYIWVYDPTMDLVDINNEVIFRGQRVNPFKLRLTETTWPVTNRMSVLYRGGDGSWLDLSKYFVPENGDTTLVVGGYNRSLSEGGSGTFPITLPDVNTTVPDVTQWDLPQWVQAQYQSPITGETKSETTLAWIKPPNTDSSTMTDLAYYDIRYRQSATPLTDFTLEELDSLSDMMSDLNTVDDPIVLSSEQEWAYITAPAEVLRWRIQELTPGMTYEAQIRAVDNGKPPNLGAWSALQQWQGSRDIFPPSTPAAPEIAANPMSVLMVHRLGKSTGGEFNLDRDLGHFELHGSTDPLYIPNDETLIGKAPADWGMITGMIPVVASFQVLQLEPMYFRVIAVDLSGNKSQPSPTAVATVDLIESQYVKNLTVDKVTAGTISADWIMGGRITTGGNGARVDLSSDGINGFNVLNQKLLQWRSSDGKLIVNGAGGIEINDGRLVVRNSNGNVIVELGECADGRHGLQIYKDNGTRVTRIGELASGTEGIEVVNDLGQLVRVSTLAFGTLAASVTTVQNRTAVAFGDLATVGPSVGPIAVGSSCRMLVGVGAWCNNTAAGVSAAASFDVAGPSGYLLAASFFRAVRVDATPQTGTDFTAIGASKFFLIDGLPQAGDYFVTMKYSSNSGTAAAQFADRHLVVMPF